MTVPRAVLSTIHVSPSTFLLGEITVPFYRFLVSIKKLRCEEAVRNGSNVTNRHRQQDLKSDPRLCRLSSHLQHSTPLMVSLRTVVHHAKPFISQTHFISGTSLLTYFADMCRLRVSLRQLHSELSSYALCNCSGACLLPHSLSRLLGDFLSTY